MTKTEFIERHRHQIGGLCMDCLVGGNGPELSLRVRTIFRNIDVLLAQAYEDLLPSTPAPKPAVNGNGHKPVEIKR